MKNADISRKQNNIFALLNIFAQGCKKIFSPFEIRIDRHFLPGRRAESRCVYFVMAGFDVVNHAFTHHVSYLPQAQLVNNPGSKSGIAFPWLFVHNLTI